MSGESCPKAPKRKAVPDKRRNADRHPSRSKYDDAEYKQNRQRKLAKTRGLCESCGKKVAERKGGRWVTTCGHIHHKVPLAKGGTNAIWNLAVLCVDCHAKVDADMRRADRRNREE